MARKRRPSHVHILLPVFQIYVDLLLMALYYLEFS